jgi:hypothetical protein
MRQPGVGDSVRFSRDVPELLVKRDELGTVCSIWFSPHDAFDVELGDGESRRRALVRSGDFAVELIGHPIDGGDAHAALPQADVAEKDDDPPIARVDHM